MVGLEPDDIIELGDTNVYRLESVNKTIKMINAMVADWQQLVEENLWD